jgi:hypothetical protein
MPDHQEATYQKEYGDKLQAEADKLNLAKKRVERALAARAQMEVDWQAIVLAKTPPKTLQEGGIDLAKNRYQLTRDVRIFRDSVQTALNKQMKKGGIKIIAAPAIPTPSEAEGSVVESFFNYPAINFPVCIFELGTVTVEGTFAQIANHVKAWSDMPNYMAVVSNLRLEGTSPTLRATYNLVLVAYVRADKISPAIAGGDAAPAGGMPAMGGGRPGMPPMGAMGPGGPGMPPMGPMGPGGPIGAPRGPGGPGGPMAAPAAGGGGK